MSNVAGLPAVGVPGASNWKPLYHRLVDDYERVIILGDGDKAGRDFTIKLAPNIANAVQRPMPEGEDVSSFIVKYGAEAFLSYALG
jgi:DNA primase